MSNTDLIRNTEPGPHGTVLEPGTRSCTCHPDDSPPVPCQSKYALTECRIAELEARLERERRRADEAENAVARGFATLSIYGVPKDRAHNVANGITVLVTRMDRELAATQSRLDAIVAMAREQQAWWNDPYKMWSDTYWQRLVALILGESKP